MQSLTPGSSVQSAAFTLLLTAACSSTTTSPAVTDAATDTYVDAGTDAVTDTPSSTDAGTDASSPTDAGDYLSLLGGQASLSVYGAPLSVSAGEAFWGPGPSENPDACTMRTANGCEVRVCGGVSGASLQLVGAGNLAWQGTSGARIAVSPTSIGLYPNSFQTMSPYLPGDTLTFTASGDTVPAFMGSITLPPAIQVQQPGAGTNPVVTRAEGFTARWSPTTGLVRVQIAQVLDNEFTALQAGITVQCLFDASTGAGSVPSTALSDLQPTAMGGGAPTIIVFATSSTVVMAGSFAIRLTANTGGVLVTGSVQ